MKIIFLFLAALNMLLLSAQNTDSHLKVLNLEHAKNAMITDSNIVSFMIPLHSTTHIISPEPISYVDISSPEVEGDMPDKKICRIKPLPGSLKEGDYFTVTIVTQSFITVYKLICSGKNNGDPTYVININPVQAMPLRSTGFLTDEDYYKLAIHALGKKRSVFNLQSSAYALQLWVNNIFIAGDFIMLDIGIKNKSALAFDIDETRFKIRDKKILSATVSQDIDLQPLYSFYGDEQSRIQKSRRNFYVFRKFTFPTDKVFTIELTEKQISGRKISLDIDYNQVLQATTL